MPLENKLDLVNVDLKFDLRKKKKIGGPSPLFWYYFFKKLYKKISVLNFFNAITEIPLKDIQASYDDIGTKVTFDISKLDPEHVQKLRKLEHVLLAENVNIKNSHTTSLLQNAEINFDKQYINGNRVCCITFYVPNKMLKNEKSINSIMHALSDNKDDKDILMQRMLSNKQNVGLGLCFASGVLSTSMIVFVVLLVTNIITLPVLPIAATASIGVVGFLLPIVTAITSVGVHKLGEKNDKEIHTRVATLKARENEVGLIPLNAHALALDDEKFNKKTKENHLNLDDNLMPYVSNWDMIKSNIVTDKLDEKNI